MGVFEIKNAHTQVDATHQVAVGDHDPLGGGGRAGGVDDDSQIVSFGPVDKMLIFLPWDAFYVMVILII